MHRHSLCRIVNGLLKIINLCYAADNTSISLNSGNLNVEVEDRFHYVKGYKLLAATTPVPGCCRNTSSLLSGSDGTRGRFVSSGAVTGTVTFPVKL